MSDGYSELVELYALMLEKKKEYRLKVATA